MYVLNYYWLKFSAEVLHKIIHNYNVFYADLLVKLVFHILQVKRYIEGTAVLLRALVRYQFYQAMFKGHYIRHQVFVRHFVEC